MTRAMRAQETLAVAVADFFDTVEAFNFWSVDHNDAWYEAEWIEEVWYDDDEEIDWAEYEERMAEERAKVAEIEATEVEYAGHMTKEYFDRYVIASVEIDGCYGKYWTFMPNYKVDLYLAGLVRGEFFSDWCYANNQEKPEIQAFLDAAEAEWYDDGHFGNGTIYEIIERRMG